MSQNFDSIVHGHRHASDIRMTIEIDHQFDLIPLKKKLSTFDVPRVVYHLGISPMERSSSVCSFYAIQVVSTHTMTSIGCPRYVGGMLGDRGLSNRHFLTE